MVNSMDPISSGAVGAPRIGEHPPLIPKEMRLNKPGDRVELGRSGSLTNEQAMNIVLERAMEKLRGVVHQARAELGIPEGKELDTSPEATANRIVEFALGFFDNYAKRHNLNDDEEGRAAYVEFISKAVYKGVDEARGILNALNALNPNVSGNIDKTVDLINQGFDRFIANGRNG